MPYLKFESNQERMKARNIELTISEQNHGQVEGLIAVINDPPWGIIFFYSSKPYLEAFDKAGIKYALIPKEQISCSDFLRTQYPKLEDEL